jgi:hypothetical protein
MREATKQERFRKRSQKLNSLAERMMKVMPGLGGGDCILMMWRFYNPDRVVAIAEGAVARKLEKRVATMRLKGHAVRIDMLPEEKACAAHS